MYGQDVATIDSHHASLYINGNEDFGYTHSARNLVGAERSIASDQGNGRLEKPDERLTHGRTP
jgi:hypothetical protein